MMMTGGEKGTEVLWVDVVVICALEVEFEALAQRLTRQPALVVDTGLGLDHFVAVEGKRLTVLVVQLPDPGAGNVTSGVVASLLIARYDPWLLISFGIAGTLDAKVVKTFDVVYSQSIFYLDLRKETGDGSVVKQPVQRATPSSLARLIRRLPHPKEYNLHKAVIVTSEAVVKSEEAERRKTAKNAVADATAVEMETFGVFQAVFVDKEAFTRTSRLCLAIKGISDAADLTKSDGPHVQASRNAAETLFTILNTPTLSALRSESGIDQRPRPLQPFIRRPHYEVLAQVKRFSGIAAPILSPVWDDSTLHAAHLHCRFPRVFFHWRLTGMGLHLVEYKFARVLRRLSDAGYPVECLITDEVLGVEFPQGQLKEDEIPEARKVTQAIIDALLPPAPESVAKFYSNIREHEGSLSSYLEAAGYSVSEVRRQLERLGALPNIRSPKLSAEFNEWLKYIAFRVRHEGACIVFYYYSREIYSLLWRFSGLLPALIPTADIKLAGRLAKFEYPGRSLFLLPPDYSDIVQWLQATSESEVVAEVWRHFIAQESLLQEDLVRERRAWSPTGLAGNLPRGSNLKWIDVFLTREEKTAEYYKGAILLELAWLNSSFFANLREERGR